MEHTRHQPEQTLLYQVIEGIFSDLCTLVNSHEALAVYLEFSPPSPISTPYLKYSTTFVKGTAEADALKTPMERR